MTSNINLQSLYKSAYSAFSEFYEEHCNQLNFINTELIPKMLSVQYLPLKGDMDSSKMMSVADKKMYKQLYPDHTLISKFEDVSRNYQTILQQIVFDLLLNAFAPISNKKDRENISPVGSPENIPIKMDKDPNIFDKALIAAQRNAAIVKRMKADPKLTLDKTRADVLALTPVNLANEEPVHLTIAVGDVIKIKDVSVDKTDPKYCEENIVSTRAFPAGTNDEQIYLEVVYGNNRIAQKKLVTVTKTNDQFIEKLKMLISEVKLDWSSMAKHYRSVIHKAQKDKCLTECQQQDVIMKYGEIFMEIRQVIEALSEIEQALVKKITTQCSVDRDYY